MLSRASQLVLRLIEATSNCVLAGIADWAWMKGGFMMPDVIGPLKPPFRYYQNDFLGEAPPNPNTIRHDFLDSFLEICSLIPEMHGSGVSVLS